MLFNIPISILTLGMIINTLIAETPEEKRLRLALERQRRLEALDSIGVQIYKIGGAAPNGGTLFPYLIHNDPSSKGNHTGEFEKPIIVTHSVQISALPKTKCVKTSPPNGCLNKVLVAHEDYFRPHCPKFFNDYKFELEEGDYDPELVSFWLREIPKYYSMSTNEDNRPIVKATYAYEIFGCPVEPYRLVPYDVDLRVIDTDLMKNVTDTELGLPYNRSYVLIEIHGQGGYSFSKTVREAGCKRPPQTLNEMVKRWKESLSELDEANFTFPTFDVKSIHHPENIWNSKNYVSCLEADNSTEELTEEILDSKYQIMERGSGNHLVFEKDSHKEIYIFLAMEVNATGDFCNFKRIFGIYVNDHKESPALLSFARFVGFFIGTILFVLAIFYFCRYRVRKQYREKAIIHRLERAAWHMLSRYESLLQNLELGREDDDLKEDPNDDSKSMTSRKKKIGSFGSATSSMHKIKPAQSKPRQSLVTGSGTDINHPTQSLMSISSRKQK